MRKLFYSGQFKKDIKLIKKCHYDLDKLKELIDILLNEKPLDQHYQDHPLQGKYASARDCHITPDWLLIYAIVEDDLRLIRTGTHADLFK